MLNAFPKIFTLGDRFTKNILNDDVEITEKIDGSAFTFGKANGELQCRSRGKQLILDAPEKLFKKAVEYVVSLKDRLPDDTIFYCEYVQKEKHNVLTYGKVPKNNLMLYGVSTSNMQFIDDHHILMDYVEILNIDVVPLLAKGKVTLEEVKKLLELDSVLGKCKIEGVVVKNYKPVIIGNQVIEVTSAKLVSEAFKEKHSKDWKQENTGKGKLDLLMTSYKSEARWNKAIQHLKEEGLIDDSPKDIGKLIHEIQRDIKEEEKESIKDELYKIFIDQIMRVSIAGFPEYYKSKLLENVGQEVDSLNMNEAQDAPEAS